MDRWPFISMLTLFLCCNTAYAQTHFRAVSNTGNNATIGIPISINPSVDGNLLDVDDEIAVFADGRVMTDSFCVGVTKWIKQSTAITVWGDNEQTSALDGMRAGTKFHFHVWRSSTNTEYANAIVTYVQGDSIYRMNGVSILASLSGGILQRYSTNVIESSIRTMPMHFALNQNYPNPFNPTTNIDFTVAADGKAVLKVYNELGQEVAQLFNGVAQAGRIIQTHFKASGLASGIYFSRLQAHGNSLVKRMVLIK